MRDKEAVFREIKGLDTRISIASFRVPLFNLLLQFFDFGLVLRAERRSVPRGQELITIRLSTFCIPFGLWPGNPSQLTLRDWGEGQWWLTRTGEAFRKERLQCILGST